MKFVRHAKFSNTFSCPFLLCGLECVAREKKNYLLLFFEFDTLYIIYQTDHNVFFFFFDEKRGRGQPYVAYPP